MKMSCRYQVVFRSFLIAVLLSLATATTSAQGFPFPPQDASAAQQQAPASAPVPVPQAVGPKAPGKIRVCIAPTQAQVGQGNDLQGDYGTPIRNSIILTMSGPAVDIAPLDSHLAIQLQAEAQQKECDFVVNTTVSVKHSGGSGFGKLMKQAAPVTTVMTGGLAGGLGGGTAGQVAGVAAMSAQQAAINQLSGINQQIKNKDDVAFGYQMFQTGQDKPLIMDTFKGKAKTDGEDVLTPMIQQAANTILTESIKKQ